MLELIMQFFCPCSAENMKKDSYLTRRHKSTSADHTPEKTDSNANEKYSSGLLRILLLAFICFRLVNIIFVTTSFVPDEYWQSLEVAHRTVYGYGYLTWEWSYGLRSYLYPAMFSIMYSILHALHMDTVQMIIYSPRVIQALISAVADCHLYMFAKEHFGTTVAKFTVFSCLCNWFWWYCATRTIINTLECSALCFALFYYPWKIDQEDNARTVKFQIVAIVMTVMRPTAAIFWFPLVIWHLFRSTVSRTVMAYIAFGLAIGSLSLLVDRIFYGQWIIAHWNFVNFNVLKGLGAHYGTHPWHWYFTQGVPVVLGSQILFLGFAFFTYSRFLNCSQIKICKCLLSIFFFTCFMLSFSGHKEFRFILHLIPIASVFCGLAISNLSSYYRRVAVLFLLMTNVPIALYTGLWHQGGTLRIMDDVRDHLELTCDPKCPAGLLILTPCHATPLYSHLHTNVTVRFIECPPNLEEIGEYADESDVFFANPKSWLDENIFSVNLSPKHYEYHWIIMFDDLYSLLKDYVPLKNYEICGRAFHTHFPEGRTSKDIYLLCMK